jgi:hypothetical protein
MTMQFDVKASHLSGSGLMVSGRVRLKNLIYLGTGTAGTIDLFDTTTAPVTTATYARSGTTVTVTQTAHGLTTGQNIGITFAAATGVSATAGNYVVTVLTSSTFTITDLNSGTIAGGTACTYSTGKWISGYNTGTGVQPFQVIVPGEGVLAQNGIYATVTNIVFQTVHYG